MSGLSVLGADPVSHSLIYDAQGNLSVKIVNHHQAPITSFLVLTKQYQGAKLKADTYTYFDSSVNRLRDKPILSNQELQVTVVPAEMSQYRSVVSLEGVLFADGNSFGNPDGIFVLRGRRQEMLRAISEALGLLSHTKAGQTPLQLQHEIDSMTQRADVYLPGQRKEYQVRIISKLITQGITSRLNALQANCASSCFLAAVEDMNRDLNNWRGQLAAVPENIGAK